MALKKSEIYSTLWKCANKLRSNSGLGAETFKNYVLILLFLKYISDRIKSGERTNIEVPEGCTFDDIIAHKGKTTIGDKINKVIGKIAEENELQDVISITDHDFCDKKLGSLDEASKLISELVGAFQIDGLDFSKNRAADDDLIGDAYEFLMRNFASQAGKDKGQFYTPTEVSRLMALLIGIDKDERKQVAIYDPTCGSGSLLLRVKAAAKHGVSLDGQDIDPANIELSYLNMVLHGYDTADIRVGDTLNMPQHTVDGKLMTYDYVVSNPKFSLHNWMSIAKEEDTYHRWNHEIGVPPQQYGDYAFLLHCLKSLKPDGKCAIILPNGVLTRGGEEARIRRWLVEQHLLTGIIAFPANAFFGTSIAGNVLILDKTRARDGIFFIDASNLGYKDEDSKIRLREQDIKRVIDAWDARKDIPHFAHLATYEAKQLEGEDHPMYQVERNNFALNLSLYVTPEDKEIHHSIDAHLHGGIPEADVERLEKFWSVCPTLQADLFKPFRAGHVTLAVPNDQVISAIEHNTSFSKQVDVYEAAIKDWAKQTEPLMLAIDKDNDPKSLIATWGQQILDRFMGCPSLVDAYDVYDQLMEYYKSTLQDDLFMISKDGWRAPLTEPTKKSPKYTDLVADLLPIPLALEHFHADLKAKYDDKEAELSSLQAQMQSLLEDNEDDFQESLFYGKFNAGNVQKKLDHCNAVRLSEKDEAFLQSLLPFFEKSNKANKEAVAKMAASRPDLIPEGTALTKKVVNTILSLAANWEYSTPEQRDHWQQYLDFVKQEKELKAEVKKLDKEIYAALVDTYASLTPEIVKPIIVGEKWLVGITSLVSKQMEIVMHSITAEVSALARRYEHTLSELQTAYSAKESAVLGHLADMGFTI